MGAFLPIGRGEEGAKKKNRDILQGTETDLIPYRDHIEYIDLGATTRRTNVKYVQLQLHINLSKAYVQ